MFTAYPADTPAATRSASVVTLSWAWRNCPTTVSSWLILPQGATALRSRTSLAGLERPGVSLSLPEAGLELSLPPPCLDFPSAMSQTQVVGPAGMQYDEVL
jgi:hypothetical protein